MSSVGNDKVELTVAVDIHDDWSQGNIAAGSGDCSREAEAPLAIPGVNVGEDEYVWNTITAEVGELRVKILPN